MDISDLLRDSISQIDSLYDYYLSQKEYVEEHCKTCIKRYKYGFLLSRFFSSQLDPQKSESFCDEEMKIINQMVDYSLTPGDELTPAIIRYRLRDNFTVGDSYELDPNKAWQGVIGLVQQPLILSESVLMMLLIRYEDSISQLYRYLIERYPQAFLSDKTISYSELFGEKSDVEDIKKTFVDNEIDRIMRQPISDWYSSFKKRQKATFLFTNDLFDQFKEIYYRRNLVVHNQGIVNGTYLSNVKSSKAQKGDRLFVDSDYLERAFSLTSLMIIDTYFGLRRQADDTQQLVDWLINYGFDCLLAAKWDKARYINNVLLQDKSIKSIDRLVSQINLWIAIKNTEGVPAIADEVNNLDVSALQLRFSVAKPALLNDFSTVLELLEECLAKSEITPQAIKTWPLFNEFRESDEYKQLVEKYPKEMENSLYNAPTENEEAILENAEQDEESGCTD